MADSLLVTIKPSGCTAMAIFSLTVGVQAVGTTKVEIRVAASSQGQGNKLIEVRARGDEGTEQMQVVVNGQAIATFDVTTNWETYSVRTDLYRSGDDVEVRFLNDNWDPSRGIDANLHVDRVIADGHLCETEDPSTFGYGTWSNGGFFEGYHESETLHSTGFFRYKFDGDPPVDPPVDPPQPAKASLGDKVWFDNDGDGRQDGGEPGVQDVKVTLDGGGIDGILGTFDDTMEMVRTDSSGMYRFDDLTPGVEYKVTFSDLPEGFEFTTANVSNDSLDSDANPSTGMTEIVTLAPGEHNPSIDAGIIDANTAPECVHEQEIIVRNAYNNGRGRTVTLDLSEGIRDADGDDLTYKLDFDESFFVEGRRAGVFGWEVLSFNENTGALRMQVVHGG